MKIANLFFCFIIIFSKNIASSEEVGSVELKNNLLKYKNFSAKITQIQNNQISLGNISIANDRIRLDYNDPANLTIIISSNKGMYYNKDLNEVEYFNTAKTEASIFYETFYNDLYLGDFKIRNEEKILIYEKRQKSGENLILLKLVFEKNPLLLRQISLKGVDLNYEIGLGNHNFNPLFKRQFFSMANPTIN